MGNKWFYSRGLTSLTVVASFIIMTVTGIVLYFTPQGRVAYWIIWKFLGLTKTDWTNIHIVSSIIFAVAGGFHIYFNWKPIINYFSGKIEGALKYGKELAVTGVISVLMIVGSIYLFPPFNYVIEFSEYLKGAWVVTKDYEPPFGHAEDVSLKVFAKKMGIDITKATEELKARGIKFESVKQKLKAIAEQNNIIPMDIYVAIKKFEEKPVVDGEVLTPEMVEVKFSGTGIGRKAISWMIAEIGISPELAKERLSRNGITADDSETLKQIAERYETEAIDILKVMLIEDYEID